MRPGTASRAWLPSIGGMLAVMLTAGVGLSFALSPADARTPSDHVGARVDGSATEAVYELTDRRDPSQPLRWQACEGIDYRVDERSMPHGVRPVVQRVMRSLQRQTGVRFRDAGSTARAFDDLSASPRPTVFISFTSARTAFGETFEWPGEIGIGGPISGRGRSSDGDEVITTGRVLLSTAFDGPLTGPGATWQSLIAHEVGHALNLGHRQEAGEMMNPALTAASPGRLRPDEVEALGRVLQRVDCVP